MQIVKVQNTIWIQVNWDTKKVNYISQGGIYNLSYQYHVHHYLHGLEQCKTK